MFYNIYTHTYGDVYYVYITVSTMLKSLNFSLNTKIDGKSQLIVLGGGMLCVTFDTDGFIRLDRVCLHKSKNVKMN